MKYEGTIQLAIDWIEEHLHEEICADDIAYIAGFSKYHFHRIFQNTVGMSVSEYTRMRRLTNAATVLLHTEERILDIALHLQFESQEAFTRAFKKMYRLPPGQFRRVMRDIVMTKKEVSSMEEQIKGWFLSGSHPFHYVIVRIVTKNKQPIVFFSVVIMAIVVAFAFLFGMVAVFNSAISVSLVVLLIISVSLSLLLGTVYYTKTN